MSGPWQRWAHFVSRHPRVLTFAAIAIIVTIIVPFFSLQLGSSDQGSDPAGSTTRQAYDLLAQGFGPGFNGPLTVVGSIHNPGDLAAMEQPRRVAQGQARRRLGRAADHQSTKDGGDHQRHPDDESPKRENRGADRHHSQQVHPSSDFVIAHPDLRRRHHRHLRRLRTSVDRQAAAVRGRHRSRWDACFSWSRSAVCSCHSLRRS